jgi:hypothetical protein
MTRPRLSQLMTWEKHVTLVLEVLAEALLLLKSSSPLPKTEIDLNRELYWCLLKANQKLSRMGRGLDHPPVPEGKNPPDPDDTTRSKREDKIPDFYWGFIDHAEPDHRRCARNLFIECKRLGKPNRASWIFNQNYVHCGVIRFTTTDHGYSKGEKSAVMVGYLQSMEFEEVLKEVNLTITSLSLSPLKGPLNGWQKGGISELTHKLARSFPISPMLLQHFWVDLRTIK